MRLQKIISVKKIGRRPTRDLEVDHPDHNFYANGVVVSNSHSYAYAYIGYCCMWLKTKYPLEWWKSVLENSNLEDLKEASRHVGDYVVPPDINKSALDFHIIDDGIGKLVFPLNRIKNVKGGGSFITDARCPVPEDGSAPVEKPFESLEDFYNRVEKRKVNKRVVVSLIWAGAFDGICGAAAITDRNRIYREYLALKKEKVPEGYQDLSEADVMKRQMEVLAIGSADFVELLRCRTGKTDILNPAEVARYTDKTRVTVGGLATRVSTIFTKKKEKMAFVDLVNESGTVSITVFPREFVRYKDDLKEQSVMMVDGTVNRYGGKVGLIAEQIVVLKDEIPEAAVEHSDEF